MIFCKFKTDSKAEFFSIWHDLRIYCNRDLACCIPRNYLNNMLIEAFYLHSILANGEFFNFPQMLGGFCWFKSDVSPVITQSKPPSYAVMAE